MCVRKFFKEEPNNQLNLSSLDFYLWTHLKAFLYSPPNKNEDKLHRRIFYVCQTIRNHPGIFEGV